VQQGRLSLQNCGFTKYWQAHAFLSAMKLGHTRQHPSSMQNNQMKVPYKTREAVRNSVGAPTLCSLIHTIKKP